MDLGGVAAVGTVAVALVLGVWSIVGDRSYLRQLERVSAVIESLPRGSEERKVLEELRDGLAQRVGLARYGPLFPRQRLVGWVVVILGAAFLVITVRYWILGLDFWRIVIPYALGFVLTLGGHATLQNRSRKRREWESIEWARRLTVSPD